MRRQGCLGQRDVRNQLPADRAGRQGDGDAASLLDRRVAAGKLIPLLFSASNMVVTFWANSDPSSVQHQADVFNVKRAGCGPICQMPWPGVRALMGVVDGLGTNSEPSVSIAEPSVVNVTRPGI
jgi:hypothetical protein